jgi:hypothetical protein
VTDSALGSDARIKDVTHHVAGVTLGVDAAVDAAHLPVVEDERDPIGRPAVGVDAEGGRDVPVGVGKEADIEVVFRAEGGVAVDVVGRDAVDRDAGVVVRR